MTKKSVIISTLILLFAFLIIGIINSLMGRPSLFTDKLKTNDNSKDTVQAGAGSENTIDDYSYVPLENILKPGMTGDEVKRVQFILKQKGFYAGEITGEFDDKLKKAVLDFQKSCKLSQTGIINLDTIAALTNGESPTQAPSENTQVPDSNSNQDNSKDDYQNVQFSRDIYPGMTGEDVKKAQYLLGKLGYYKGDISGNYDESTKKAVIAFQQDNNITMTGNVGKKTQAALTK